MAVPQLQLHGESNPGVASAGAGHMQALGGDTLPEVIVGANNPNGSNNSSGGGVDWSMFSDPTMQNIGVTLPNSPNVTGLDGSGQSGLSSVLSSMGLTGSNLGALAPELAVAGVGLAQAKSAQNDATKQANQIKGPSQNLINAGNQQLQQFQSQKLTPAQQGYVDFTSAEGQQIIQSGQALNTIAQQAFGDYASGKLPPADELQLQQQVQAQKQQMASQLAGSGVADSSILAGYNQQIENQAMITRQNLLDARFQTGVSAYNQWLNSTTQGIQVKTLGAQFAQSSFQDMMKNSLALESQGMAGLEEAIALTIQSDNQLSQSVSQLMGNLAAAYAYTVSGPGRGGGAGGGGGAAGGGGGAGGGLLNSLVNTGMSKGVNYLVNQGVAAAGGGAASALPAGVSSAVTDSSIQGGLSGVGSSIAGLDLGGGAAAAGGGTAAAAGGFATGGAAGADAAAGVGSGGFDIGGASALGVAAAGLGGVLAIPAIGQGIEGAFEALFPTKGGDVNQASLLKAPDSGLQQRTISSSPGGAQSFGLGSQQLVYQGKPIVMSSSQTKTANQLYMQGKQSGNMMPYENFMKTIPVDNSPAYKAVGGTGQGSTATGGGAAPTPFGG